MAPTSKNDFRTTEILKTLCAVGLDKGDPIAEFEFRAGLKFLTIQSFHLFLTAHLPAKELNSPKFQKLYDKLLDGFFSEEFASPYRARVDPLFARLSDTLGLDLNDFLCKPD